MIKVIYNKVCGRCVQSEPLTSGMVGQPIHFEYSHDFDGLAVTAVFTDGKNTVDVVNPGNECIIPHEVLTNVGAAVKVGIYAVRGDELVIPTVYATIGFVLKGADPNGGISEVPTLPVWAQTQAMIGNLSELETQAKENLVVAVNEVKNTTDGKQDAINDLEAIRSGASKGATALQSVPNSYRTAAAQDVIDNGLSDRVSVIEGKEAGWNGKYSKPTDGIPKTDLANDVQASLDKAETALQEHQSLAAYRTAEAQNIIDNTKQDKLIAGENITIAADGKTISAKGGGGGVQPDWNQNDSTAADYVKNRPFYTGNPVETVLVEESTVSFADAGGLYQGQFLTTFEATVGETYKVYWDGASYESACVDYSGYIAIGNLSIAGAGSDTGEPFLMLVNNGRGIAFYTADTSVSHTFSISGFIAQNIQIPDKYISDTFRDVIIAGNPLKWSAADWTKYYDLFQGGKLLKINSYIGSDFEGYVLSMFYAAGVGPQISVITPTGGFFKLSSNRTTNELYWAPVFNLDMLYFGYLQTGSGPNTFDREEYKRLEIAGGGLTFTTKTSAENPVQRKVVLEGDNVSAFTNDAGYLTLATLPKYEGVVE